MGNSLDSCKENLSRCSNFCINAYTNNNNNNIKFKEEISNSLNKNSIAIKNSKKSAFCYNNIYKNNNNNYIDKENDILSLENENLLSYNKYSNNSTNIILANSYSNLKTKHTFKNNVFNTSSNDIEYKIDNDISKKTLLNFENDLIIEEVKNLKLCNKDYKLLDYNLKKVVLFENLSNDYLKKLINYMHRIHVPKDYVIINNNDKYMFYFIVINGKFIVNVDNKLIVNKLKTDIIKSKFNKNLCSNTNIHDYIIKELNNNEYNCKYVNYISPTFNNLSNEDSIVYKFKSNKEKYLANPRYCEKKLINCSNNNNCSSCLLFDHNNILNYDSKKLLSNKTCNLNTSNKNQSITSYELNSEDYFGVHSLLEYQKFNGYVKCLENSCIYALTKQSLQLFLKKINTERTNKNIKQIKNFDILSKIF